MKTKAPGYFISFAPCVLAVAAAVCYGVLFPGIEYKEQVFDVRICVILAAAGVVGIVLLLLGEHTAGFAPAVLCVASGISIMMFISMVIWPIADTIYGIEPFPQFTQLVICAVLIAATLLVSEVALYLKKYRANEA